MDQINKFQTEDANVANLCLPRRADGSLYELEHLKQYPDQYNAVIEIMSHLKCWFDSTDGYVKEQPVRYMIIGSAGSGKSTVVNTLVTLIRNMCGYRNAIQVFAPTGAAAAAANGKTIHNGLQISVKKPWSGTQRTQRTQRPKNEISGKQRETLMRNLQHTLVMVFDEFSMISAELIKKASANCKATAHNGNNPNVPWGGIPIIILSGDAMQLPSIQPGICSYGSTQSTSTDIMEGMNEFLQFQDNVTMLTAGKRQRSGQTEFGSLLQHAREDTLKEEHVSALKRLTFSEAKNQYSPVEWKQITEEAAYVYAKREHVREKNSQRLYEVSSSINPVARIHCRSFKRQDNQLKAIASHFSSTRNDSIQTLICKNATVQIEGRNFVPEWGLYNHADGRVVDIVYSKDKSPNKGDLPLYIVVHIKEYSGPVWDKSNPKHVPMPVTVLGCDHGCCERHYIPLQLAFARTIHSFQGKSAGPTDEGKQNNAFRHLIVDVGDSKFEVNSPGLFYVAFSRATTIGDHNGKGSAIYFQDNCVSVHRLTNMTKTQKSGFQNDSEKVRKRNIFLNRVEESSKKHKVTKETISEVEDWISVSNFSKLDIQREIDKRIHKWDGQ